jgi:hydrogenase maturation protein HypF
MNQPDLTMRNAAVFIRRAIRVEGIVQGVGFRPFVYSLAARLGLGGNVVNDQRGVVIEVEGTAGAVGEFVVRLQGEAPILASIDRVSIREIAARGEREFTIAPSRSEGSRQTLIAPDTATCADCLREIFDPANRRYRYPFTNCTNCGPRFTIIRDIPYDRPSTTMAAFAMCALCAREYHDPSDRRFHAQPICCPRCGPRLRLIDRVGGEVAGDPIDSAARLIAAGHIVAVKGLGGYHLAAAAANEAAAGALRSRKHREDKPFAVMAIDMASARKLALIDQCEEALLSGLRRPIVLVRRRQDARLASAVAPDNRFVGLMLPYTPLHHLLCERVGEPIVLTSGNISDEPIAYDDDDAIERLAQITDCFLTHDRPIHIRTDDSVVRVACGREMPIRRSRGYAPAPLTMPLGARRPILSCGAELKSTFCLVRDRTAFISQHIGDLENYRSLRAFTEGIEHLRRLFEIDPQVVVHDLHPEYLSTKYALGLHGVDLIAVQHHHAHIAACLADNGEEGPAIGVAFDGLGYGADATLWGGEFMVADLRQFRRVGHFETVPMPGGAAAIKQPWRMALAYLDRIYGRNLPTDLEVWRRNRSRWDAVTAAVHAKVNSPLTSSAGRLFDAAASIAGIRDAVNYEGQAAIEFEQIADVNERGAYRAAISRLATIRIAGADLVRSAVDDIRAGTPREVVSARFHNGIAQTIAAVCDMIRGECGLNLVALSGGVFQNILLLERASQGLLARGFRVITHSRVPANDAGISLGQAAIAAANDIAPAAPPFLSPLPDQGEG